MAGAFVRTLYGHAGYREGPTVDWSIRARETRSVRGRRGRRTCLRLEAATWLKRSILVCMLCVRECTALSTRASSSMRVRSSATSAFLASASAAIPATLRSRSSTWRGAAGALSGARLDPTSEQILTNWLSNPTRSEFPAAAALLSLARGETLLRGNVALNYNLPLRGQTRLFTP